MVQKFIPTWYGLEMDPINLEHLLKKSFGNPEKANCNSKVSNNMDKVE